MSSESPHLLSPLEWNGLELANRVVMSPMTLEESRGIYSGRLMGNCGYERDDAERRIADGHVDLIAIGMTMKSVPRRLACRILESKRTNKGDLSASQPERRRTSRNFSRPEPRCQFNAIRLGPSLD